MPTDKKISEFPATDAGKILDSNKKIVSELQRVVPSAVVTLYEIDIEHLLIENLIPYDERRFIDVAVGDYAGQNEFH